MIEILPPIYANELFYSWISRYRTFSGNSNKNAAYNLFNREKNIQATVLYPHYLEHFCSNISEQLNIKPEYLIQYHSIMPLFKLFIDENEYENLIISYIKEDKATVSKRRISIYSNKTRKLYFCNECYKEYYEKHGEYYVNRIHQIPGNEICSKHLIKLSEFQNSSNFSNSEFIDINNYVLNNEDKCNNEYISKSIDEEQINLSYDIDVLFNANLENQNIKLTTDKYDVILQKKGYKIKDGPINRTKLKSDFNLYYSKEFLKNINSFVDEEDENGWLNIVGTQNCRYMHPTKHLLFIRFLFGSLFNFIKFNYIEEQMNIDYDLKLILLTANINDMLNKFDGSFYLIFKNAERLKILDDCYYNIRNESLNDNVIQNFKKEILEYIPKDKYTNKENLQALIKSKYDLEYHMLNIKEKEWLDNIINGYICNNTMQPQSKLNKTSINKSKIKWKQKDEQLSKLVIKAIKEIKNEIPVRQITQIYISKKIAYRFRNENLELLPNTMKIIEENIETIENYKKRKILYEIKRLRSEGEELVFSKIPKKINISKDYHKYREFILNAMENIDKL